MPDYKEMYFHLAGKLADAVEALDNLSEKLKAAQHEEEEVFIEERELNIK